MSIDLIIPEEKLLPHEIILVSEQLANPLVQKYLRILGKEDSKDLLSLHILDMPDKDIANRHHFISGKLAVLTTLLSITPIKEH